jgi:hypothetical protein
MKTTTSQPTFVAARDWREPQAITPHGLDGMIAEAAGSGYEAIRMEVTRFPFGYRVTFQRNSGDRPQIGEENSPPIQTHTRFSESVKGG